MRQELRKRRLEVSLMEGNGKNVERKLALTLTILVALSLPLQDAIAGDDLNFGSQSWSIVPSSDSARQSETSKPQPQAPSHGQSSQSELSAMPVQPVMPPSTRGVPVVEESAPPMKLYGRIEELSGSAGARIPLKMVAMTPIRDTSLDKPARLSGKVNESGRMTSLSAKIDKIPDATIKLTGKTSIEVESFPIDYTGTWSGTLTVSKVDFDPSYFEFDKAEAEKQQELVKPGVSGSCSVTFYKSGDRVDMQPTQVVFQTTTSAAEAMKSVGDSPLAAMLGMNGSMANNPALANMQVPYMFAMPLGNLGGNRGVTGNQLGSELMKNTLRELAKGVLEEQVVTKDSDRNAAGQVKITFTESVLRFTRQIGDRLYCQAAAVSYDEHGNYLNKVILSGMLDKGAGNGQPNMMTGGAGGLGSMFGQFGMGAGGGGGAGQGMDMQGLGALGGLLGGQGGGAGGGAGQGMNMQGLGALGGLLGGQGGGAGMNMQGLGALGGLLGGQGGGGGGAGQGMNMQGLQGLLGGQGGGQGGGADAGLGGMGGANPAGAVPNMMNQMQEVQKMLQEMP